MQWESTISDPETFPTEWVNSDRSSLSIQRVQARTLRNKMLNERNIGPREDLRESLFLERYQRLLAWAMRLTKYDRAGAEDLVQDAFIQFTRGRTSLDTITNIDGYLRRMLHYLNLARVARLSEQMHRQSL